MRCVGVGVGVPHCSCFRAHARTPRAARGSLPPVHRSLARQVIVVAYLPPDGRRVGLCQRYTLPRSEVATNLSFNIRRHRRPELVGSGRLAGAHRLAAQLWRQEGAGVADVCLFIGGDPRGDTRSISGKFD